MLCTVKNITVFIHVQGDAGFQNQSQAEIGILHLGKLKLSEVWDLTPLVGREAKSLILSVPSGVLTLKSDRPVAIAREGKWMVIHFPLGKWEGQIAGLEGGMSGFFGFKAEEIASIEQGTFLIPSDRPRGLIAFGDKTNDVDLSPEGGVYNCPPERYFKRKCAFWIWAEQQGQDPRLLAKKANDILKKPSNDRAEEQRQWIAWFHQLLKDFDDIGDLEEWKKEKRAKIREQEKQKQREEFLQEMKDFLAAYSLSQSKKERKLWTFKVHMNSLSSSELSKEEEEVFQKITPHLPDELEDELEDDEDLEELTFQEEWEEIIKEEYEE